MVQKPRNKASLDAAAVARMMAQQDEGEPAETAIDEPAAPAQEEPQPPVRIIAPAASLPARPLPEGFDPGKVDGRTLRRTGREPFATRIKPETHEALRRIAYTRGVTIAEAVEMAVAAFDAR